jgi:2-polyprenyl-6-methoxyphenol hydroxylase-like FAD-dependent oxidoreductase
VTPAEASGTSSGSGAIASLSQPASSRVDGAMHQSPIIVAGGGIGGSAAALVLARQGHAVEVLEQADAFGEIGAGIQLGPNVFRLFEHLGLTEPIRRVAYFPPNLVMRDVRSGELVVRSPVGEHAMAAYRQPYAVIYRVDLNQVLLDACRGLSSIGLLVKSKVTGFAPCDAGVDVHLADGRQLQAAALIGADGLWSRVREQIVGDGKPRVSGHIAYRAVLPMEQVPAHLYSPDVTLWGARKRTSCTTRCAVASCSTWWRCSLRGGLEHLRRSRGTAATLRAGRAAGQRAAGQDRDVEDVGAV